MSLPGQIRPLSDMEDYACNHHDCFEPATYSICTEADSMGAEYEYYCDEHIEELRQNHEDTVGQCEWCHTDGVVIRPFQDPEEGPSGPVYWICSSCKSEQLAASRDDDDDDLWDDDDEDV